MTGYSGLYVQKTGDTMSGDLNIQAPAGDNYSALRLKSNNENEGVTIEWNGNADRRRINVYNFPADSQYAEAYQFPVNSLNSSATAHQYYYIITTKELYKTFPVGSCYTTNTNTNPSSILGGGTWTLVNKYFASYCENITSAFTINTTNTSEITSCYVYRSGQFVFVRLNIKNKVALVDGSALEMGTFNFNKLGLIDEASLTNYSNWSYCDALNGSMSYTVSSSTGILKNMDITSGSSTSTGLSLYYNIFMPVTFGHMLDSACDTFIWKRTA